MSQPKRQHRGTDDISELLDIAYGLHKDDNDELIADVQLEHAAALQTPALWSQTIARCPVGVLPALGMHFANAEVSAAYQSAMPCCCSSCCRARKGGRTNPNPPFCQNSWARGYEACDFAERYRPQNWRCAHHGRKGYRQIGCRKFACTQHFVPRKLTLLLTCTSKSPEQLHGHTGQSDG